jgi:hypothetical protein
MSHLRLLLLTVVIICAAPLSAQVAPRIDSTRVQTADSSAWANGWYAGRAAAGTQPVTGRAAAGFLGGLPVGMFGFVALSQRDALPVIAAGGGLAVIGAAAMPGRMDPPAAVAATAAARGVTFERAFVQGYAERLGSRRRSAALVGGVAGAATGLGILVLLLSQITT